MWSRILPDRSSPEETSTFVDGAIARAEENIQIGHYWIALHDALSVWRQRDCQQ